MTKIRTLLLHLSIAHKPRIYTHGLYTVVTSFISGHPRGRPVQSTFYYTHRNVYYKNNCLAQRPGRRPVSGNIKKIFSMNLLGREHREGHGWSEKESLVEVRTGNSFLVDKQWGVLYAYDTDSAPISVFSVTGGGERTCQIISMSMSSKTGQELP